MINLDWYRAAVVVASVAVFFTNFSDYAQRWGLIPLLWIVLLGGLAAPLLIPAMMAGRVQITPLVIWAAGFLLLTIAWYYPSTQTGASFRDLRLRFLSVLFLGMMLVILSQPREQRTARITVAFCVLLAVALNVYELFNPMTFSEIPGRSAGLYSNVNQSGAALILGLIIAYDVVPARCRMLFVSLTAIGIITTFSRSAMIGWVIVMIYFAFRGGFGIAQLRRVLLLCSLVFGFIVSPYWDELRHTLEKRGTLTLDVVQRLRIIGGDASSDERSQVATYAWRMFTEQPLTGFGTGQHRQLEDFVVSTHNVYLAMMIDHGILGLFLLPLFILATLWGLPRSHLDLALPFAMFLGLWGLVSHNVFEERYILVAVALIGSIIATHRVRAEASQGEVTPAVMPVGLPA